jgi:hypothetical protein
LKIHFCGFYCFEHIFLKWRFTQPSSGGQGGLRGIPTRRDCKTWKTVTAREKKLLFI